MKKKVILLSIQIFIVAIVLALTVTAYAWFVSQTRVDVTETVITAAAGANTVIENEEDFTYVPYMGQTGLGVPGGDTAVDCPYSVEKKLRVNFRPLTADSRITANLNFMSITRTTGETASSNTAGNADILKKFTWRIKISRTNEDGTMEYPYGNFEYGPDENGFACRTDESGNVFYCALDAEATFDITFSLIYLDEAGYKNYLSGNYGAENITEFAYCGYENMRAVFNCTFEIGLDTFVASGAGGEG